MNIEILNQNGDFEMVDAREHLSSKVAQFVSDAKEFGEDFTEEEAFEVLLEPATYGATPPTFAECKMAEKGWYGGAYNADEGGYVFMSQKCFTGSRIQRTVYAESLHAAVKSLKHPRG